jgi:hypothetical protein
MGMVISIKSAAEGNREQDVCRTLGRASPQDIDLKGKIARKTYPPIA